MKEIIPEKETELAEVEERLREELLKIPNMTHPDAPVGRDDSENVEIRRWGEIPDFGFEVKDHIEIGDSLGIIDFAAGTKVAGSKFYSWSSGSSGTRWMFSSNAATSRPSPRISRATKCSSGLASSRGARRPRSTPSQARTSRSSPPPR